MPLDSSYSHGWMSDITSAVCWQRVFVGLYTEVLLMLAVVVAHQLWLRYGPRSKRRWHWENLPYWIFRHLLWVGKTLLGQGSLEAWNVKHRVVKSYAVKICACAKERNWKGSLSLLDEMLRKRIQPTTLIYNVVIGVCGKCDECDVALRLFYDMQKRGVRPDGQTYTTLAVNCRGRRLDKSVEFIQRMVEAGYRVDAITLNAVIGACVNNMPQKALSLMESLPDTAYSANVGTVNSLITCCERTKKPAEAVRLFRWMQQRGIAPTAVTFNILITTLGKANPDIGLSLFGKMQEEGVKPDVTTFNLLISACARTNKVGKALNLFESMKEAGVHPDVVTYGALIAACNRRRQSERSLQIFQEMVERGVDPDTVVYNAAIKACDVGGQADVAVGLFQDLKARGLTPNLITYSTLITACARGSAPEQAISFFEELCNLCLDKPDQVAFCAVLLACSVVVDADKAEQYFQEMDVRGVKKEVLAYNSYLSALVKAGKVEKARGVFRGMRGEGVEPNANSYTTLISAVPAEEAQALFSEMLECGIEPRRKTYDALASAQQAETSVGLAAAGQASLHHLVAAEGAADDGVAVEEAAEEWTASE